jgi:transketolase
MRRAADLRDPGSFDHVGRDAGAHFVAGDVLSDLADSDTRIVCGTADLKYVTQMAGFAARHPDRFFEFGISERNMLSAAAGMATCGLLPYVSTFASFSGILGYEAIRTDHAYPRLPVRVLATHAGISMGFFGTSHHALEDISALRAVAGLTIVSPSDRYSVEALVRSTVDVDGPVYFRMSRGQEENLYDEVPEAYFTRSPYEVRPGNDAVLVATGIMVRECKLAAEQAERETGVNVGVLDVHTLKPFPGQALAARLAGAPVVVTVEEHNVEGGLGTMVVEALASAGVQVPVYKHGLLDEFALVGPPTHLYAYYGLDAAGIATVLGRALRQGTAAGRPQALWTPADRENVLGRYRARSNGQQQSTQR